MTQEEFLHFLEKHPRKWYIVRDLARHINVNNTSAWRCMESLYKQGFVRRRLVDTRARNYRPSVAYAKK